MNKQEYLLTCIAEEASEIIKETSKINRFGARTEYRDNEMPVTRLIREFTELCSLMDIYYDEFVRESDFPFGKIHADRKEQFSRYWEKYSLEAGVE